VAGTKATNLLCCAVVFKGTNNWCCSSSLGGCRSWLFCCCFSIIVINCCRCGQEVYQRTTSVLFVWLQLMDLKSTCAAALTSQISPTYRCFYLRAFPGFIFFWLHSYFVWLIYRTFVCFKSFQGCCQNMYGPWVFKNMAAFFVFFARLSWHHTVWVCKCILCYVLSRGELDSQLQRKCKSARPASCLQK